MGRLVLRVPAAPVDDDGASFEEGEGGCPLPVLVKPWLCALSGSWDQQLRASWHLQALRRGTEARGLHPQLHGAAPDREGACGVQPQSLCEGASVEPRWEGPRELEGVTHGMAVVANGVRHGGCGVQRARGQQGFACRSLPAPGLAGSDSLPRLHQPRDSRVVA